MSGAALIFIAILSGTLGAHLWQDLLQQHGGLSNFTKARDYLFIHGLSVMLLASFHDRYPAARLDLIALLQFVCVLLFSGSLMIAALTGLKWITFITPTGGSGLLLSWLLVCWRAGKIR